MRTKVFICTLASAFCFLAVTPLMAQSRDHLTPQEVELVQEAQILDKRIDVFIKAIDRRMQVLNNAQPSNPKQFKKDSEMWGELPSGTHAELFGDIAGILEEAITNIDDVSMHDARNPLLPKAIRKLSAEAKQLADQMGPMRAQAKSESETSGIEQILENAQLIADAEKKLPAATEPDKNKNKKAKDKP